VKTDIKKVRVMRVLTASGVCKEEGEGIYSHNALSTFLSDTHHIAIAKFVYFSLTLSTSV